MAKKSGFEHPPMISYHDVKGSGYKPVTGNETSFPDVSISEYPITPKLKGGTLERSMSQPSTYPIKPSGSVKGPSGNSGLEAVDPSRVKPRK